MKNNTQKILGTIAWIIFLISFAAYIPVIFSAIFGIDVGFFIPNYTYGGEAVYFTLFVFTIIPIIPICAIYEIIYSIITLRHSSKKRKKGVLILVATIVGLIIIPTCIYDSYKVHLNREFYKKYYPVVEEYMEGQFTSEVYESRKLKRYSREDKVFIVNVKCDLGKGYADFEDGTMDVRYYVADNGEITDNLTTLFGDTYNPEFQKGMCDYMSTNIPLPDNWSPMLLIKKVDLSHYKPGDSMESLYPYCKYEASGINVIMPEYDEDKLIEATNLYYDKYQEHFSSSPSFYVIIGNVYYVKANIYTNDDGYSLYIQGYTNINNVQTVPDHEITIKR